MDYIQYKIPQNALPHIKSNFQEINSGDAKRTENWNEVR